MKLADTRFGNHAGQTYHSGINCNGMGLTSLEGSPEEVKGRFLAHDNELKTLEGSPKFVFGLYTCYNNKLTTLKGAPEFVDGNFDCSNNLLTSLEGCPDINPSCIVKARGNPNPHLEIEWRYRMDNKNQTEQEIRDGMFLLTESEYYARQEVLDLFLF